MRQCWQTPVVFLEDCLSSSWLKTMSTLNPGREEQRSQNTPFCSPPSCNDQTLRPSPEWDFDLHKQLTCASSSFTSGSNYQDTREAVPDDRPRERGEERSQRGGVFVNEMDQTWQAAEPGSKLWTDRERRMAKSESSTHTEPHKSGL